LGQSTSFLQKKWVVVLVVLLLVILVIETVLLVILINGGSIGGQSFPRLTLNPPVITNCSPLFYQLVSQNADNRTVRFDCDTPTMNISAFRVYAPFTRPSSPENILSTVAEPIFNLPPGYLNLSITGSAINFRCPASAFSSIMSGKSYEIDDDYGYHGYDYCAVISNSVNNIDGFRIQWVEGSYSNLAPNPNFGLSLSSSNITIAAGQNATVTVTVTSRYGYKGTLQFSADMNLQNSTVTSPPVTALNATYATLLSHRAVQVSLTIRTSTSTTKGTFLISVGVQSPDFYDQVDLYVKVT
jgi:hypothetical protein